MKLSYPNFNKSTLKRVQQVLNSGRVNYWTGNECKDFEKEFSNYHKIKYSIAVSNGSVALEIALKALGLKNNDEVIVTPRSFIASASCVLNLGLKPIFADIDKQTLVIMFVIFILGFFMGKTMQPVILRPT